MLQKYVLLTLYRLDFSPAYDCHVRHVKNSDHSVDVRDATIKRNINLIHATGQGCGILQTESASLHSLNILHLTPNSGILGIYTRFTVICYCYLWSSQLTINCRGFELCPPLLPSTDIHNYNNKWYLKNWLIAFCTESDIQLIYSFSYTCTMVMDSSFLLIIMIIWDSYNEGC